MKINRLFVISFVVLTLAISIVSAVQPFGVETVNEINSTRAKIDTADSVDTIAGNVTEITVDAFATTQTWAGYFGNVSGTIQLADYNDNVMYNWSLDDPEGEIFASEVAAVDWASLQCFNFAADNLGGAETPGDINQHGKGLADMETQYGIEWDDKDGINETFSTAGTHENGNALAHDLFYVNNLEFHAGECPSTHLMGPNGAIADATYEEILLYDSTNDEMVFTSRLLENDVLGFDGRDHDFEMLVLENGHLTDTDSRPYYFYVELE